MEHRFEVLTNLGAGAGCLAYATALLVREVRAPAFTRFAALLVSIGAGLFLRGLWYATGSDVVNRVYDASLGAFPLCAGLFAESVLRRSLHLPVKLLLLLGTAVFVIGPATPLFASRVYTTSFFAYQIVVLVYLVVLAATRIASTTNPTERSLRTALLAGAVVATASLVTDWLPTFGVSSPSLGAVGVFALLYVSAAAMHGGGTFRLRALLLRLAFAVVVIIPLSALPMALEPRAPAGMGTTIFLVLLFAYLVAEPLLQALAELRSRPREVLLERLPGLPTGSLQAFVDAVGTWPEVKRTVLVPPATLQAQGYDRLHAFFRGRAATVDLRDARAGQRDAGSEEDRLAAEQAALLIQTTGCAFVASLGERAPVMGISFGDVVDHELYRPVLAGIVGIAALLARAEVDG